MQGLQTRENMDSMSLLPAKMSPNEFLQATHLSIGTLKHDPEVFRSTTKQDYVSHPDCNREPAVPMKHSNVINTDMHHFTKRCTEMKDRFEFEAGQRISPCGVNISKTNYKQHADTSKFMEYDTMSKIQFHSMNGEGKQKQARAKWGDHIPQGDQDKQKESGSEYKNSFLNSLDKVISEPIERSYKPTLMGDIRQNDYATAHDDQFKPPGYGKLQPIVPTHKSNIPFGDSTKCYEKQSVFNEAYKYTPGELNQGELKSTQTSHINLGDGVNKERDTEFQSCYEYRGDMSLPQRVSMNQTRNHSDIAEGDTDAYRNRERANATTTRYHYSRFRPAEKNPTLPANVHTRSDVVIGNEKLMCDFYTTSMNQDYPMSPGHGKGCNQDTRASGKEPVKTAPYFNPISDGAEDKCQNSTVYQNSYLPSMMCKPQLNPKTLEKLQRTSIRKELPFDETNTTHKESYTPHVDVSLPKKMDVYRLQRSHFGNLNL